LIALRSQVELQNAWQQQLDRGAQRFCQAEVVLARIIGLPPGQEFAVDRESSLPGADSVARRSLLAARLYFPVRFIRRPQAQVRAAELSHRGAAAGPLSHPGPSIQLRRHRRYAQPTPTETWQVDGGINIPNFLREEKFTADLLEADSQLKQARSQLRRISAVASITKFAARY